MKLKGKCPKCGHEGFLELQEGGCFESEKIICTYSQCFGKKCDYKRACTREESERFENAKQKCNMCGRVLSSRSERKMGRCYKCDQEKRRMDHIKAFEQHPYDTRGHP